VCLRARLIRADLAEEIEAEGEGTRFKMIQVTK
jgi:hypothetical protein